MSTTSSILSDRFVGLDAAQVRAGAAGLFADDALAARAAARVFDRLLEAGADWGELARRLDSGAVSARRLDGASPAAILEQPFDLALVRRRQGDFVLLHRSDPHWRIIDGEGIGQPIDRDALATPDDLPADGHDIVMLRLPAVGDPALADIGQLWPVLRSAWMEVGLTSLFVNGGLLLLPLFALLVYDKVVANGVFETLWALVIGMLVYLLMDGAMRVVRAWSIERIAAELGERSDEQLWARIETRAVPGAGFAGFLAEYRNLASARDLVSASYLTAAADLPFFFLYLVVIGIIAWPLLILVLVLAGVYALAGLVLQARINILGKEAERAGTAKLSFMSETLNALDLVRGAPGAHLLRRRWRRLVAEQTRLDARRRLLAANGTTLAAAMSTFATVSALTLGAYLIEARMLTVGGLIAGSMLLTRAMALVASVFSLISKWEDFRRATARVEAALSAGASTAWVDKPTTGGRIDVIDVGCRYPGRPVVLDGINFSVNGGERIALLGRPGAGKSTLLRCIAGLAQPDSGQILFDGVERSQIAGADRVRWLACKSQEPIVFAGSLDENLRVSGSRPEDPRFAQALWASGLEDELQSGRMTLGMMLAERGANLSGGQRQKVALARALAQPCRILLLDEPTLGLDPDGERLLAERLPAVLGDAVLIVSTHSPLLLAVVQRIIVLDGGRIVADGTKERILRPAPRPGAAHQGPVAAA